MNTTAILQTPIQVHQSLIFGMGTFKIETFSPPYQESNLNSQNYTMNLNLRLLNFNGDVLDEFQKQITSNVDIPITDIFTDDQLNLLNGDALTVEFNIVSLW